MPNIRTFFKKLGGDTKTFFKKGGVADTGLRKFGNTLNKVGGVVEKAAPLLALAAPELAAPIMAAGALAKVGGKTALNVRSGAMRGKNIIDKTENVVGAFKGGIEAAKPSAGVLGANFA